MTAWLVTTAGDRVDGTEFALLRAKKVGNEWAVLFNMKNGTSGLLNGYYAKHDEALAVIDKLTDAQDIGSEQSRQELRAEGLIE